MKSITSFRGEYAFLSNFYSASVPFRGIIFPTAEHAYQAQKSKSPEDQKRIAQVKTPGEAKRLGRFLNLYSGWDQIRIPIMFAIIYRKFTHNKYLGKKLVATNPKILIEENTWGDKYWGKVHGDGLNLLGSQLMQVRWLLIEKG